MEISNIIKDVVNKDLKKDEILNILTENIELNSDGFLVGINNDPQIIFELKEPKKFFYLKINLNTTFLPNNIQFFYEPINGSFSEKYLLNLNQQVQEFEFFIELNEMSKKIRIDPISSNNKFKIINLDIYGIDEEYYKEKTLQNYQVTNKVNNYETWLTVNKLSTNRVKYLTENLNLCTYNPLISIIIPVYNPPINFLEKAIESVQNQIYKNYEICIVDDCSTNELVKPYLENLKNKYDNIVIEYNKKNSHISTTTNNAVDISSGEYLVFLDQDDELTPDALAEIILFLNKNNNCDLLYSDHDKIDINGNHSDPEFKPSWSPEYLLSFMYCGHLKCVKKSLYLNVGGFKNGYEGSQDYDFYLRASEVANYVGHIPRILYHWRIIPGSTAAGGNEKSYSFQAGINSVQDYLDRNNIKGNVYHSDFAQKAGLGIYSIKFPNDGKSVGIIIPTKNGYELLKRCIDSLKTTTYNNYKIYIIDNDSDEEETINYLNSLTYVTVLKIKSPNGIFSYSYINNEAVKYVKEELLLFLNNDTEVINPNWLSQMVGYLQIKGVGSVGAKLLFPNDTIQHAGIIHGLTHSFPYISGRLQPSWDAGYMLTNFSSKDYMAVTAACMLTYKDLFLEMNGFDDVLFSVAYNDCDYGYRLVEKGYRNVLAPDALLYHYEGYSRGYLDKPTEEKNYIRKYNLTKDKYYNPNFKINNIDYIIDSKSLVMHNLPKFRVLFFTHNLNMEGAPRFIYDLSCKLKEQGNIEPVIISGVDGPLKIHYDNQGIENYVLKDFNLLNLLDENLINEVFEEKKEFIKSLNIDVLYGNTVLGFWIVQVAKMLNLPSILNIHESEEPFSQINHSIYLKKLALSSVEYAYKIIFVSDASKDVFSKLESKNNYICIRNGFDHEMIKNRTKHLNRNDLRKEFNLDNKINILLLGTVAERKGQKDIIEAIKYIDDKTLEQITIHIVGDRKTLDYSKEFNKMVEELPEKIKKNIRIFDETPEDIYHFYIMADMFVCTSRIESFPKVIQEAMYFELPIVTTPVYGIKELVKDKTSALFYEPADSKKLAENIQSLIENKNLMSDLAKNAKISLDICNTANEMVDKYTQIIQEAWLFGECR